MKEGVVPIGIGHRRDVAGGGKRLVAEVEVEVGDVGDVSVVVGENRDEHRVERNGQTTKTGCVVDKADDAWKRV